MDKHTIIDKVYGKEITLVLGPLSAYKKYIKGKFKYDIPMSNDDSYSGYTLTLQHKSKTSVVIWMEDFSFTIDNYGALMHECIHAAFRILETCKVAISAENHEALAYLADYYYSELLSKVIKNKQTNKQTKTNGRNKMKDAEHFRKIVEEVNINKPLEAVSRAIKGAIGHIECAAEEGLTSMDLQFDSEYFELVKKELISLGFEVAEVPRSSRSFVGAHVSWR